jgi:transposase
MDMVMFSEARRARGAQIAKTSKIVRITDKLYAVPSQQTKGKYAVDAEAGTCMCPDFETHGRACKHVYAVMFARHQITDQDGTTTVTEAVLKITYAQPSWKAYNNAQCAEKSTVRTLLKDLCTGVGQPEYKGTGRPSFLWSDVVFGGVMKVYTGMSGRRASTDVEDCAANGLIDDAPHYNTVHRYMGSAALTPVLKKMIEESATPLKAVEQNFSVDSTGFNTATYARWFDEKYGKERKYQRWIKAHAMVGVRTNIVTSVEVTPGNRGDCLEFAGLVKSTAERFKLAEVSADKAYLSNENLELVEKLGAVPYIPFKLNSREDGGGETWQRVYHMFHANKQEWEPRYHLRSNVETTFSALKRKLGSFVRAKGETAQVNEVLAKILCFNLSCLVHEMHELGIDPKFWMSKGAQ